MDDAIQRMIFVGSFILLSSVLSSAFCADYYVSPLGNDAGAGSLGHPFKTLHRAVAAAQSGDAVYLRKGEYRETLIPVRSGTREAPIVFSGYPGEDAVLCATELVQGPWKRYRGHIYRIAGMPATWALFVDGRMMHEARWPNASIDDYFGGYATAAAGTTAGKVVDPSLPSLDLNGARVHIFPGAAWVSYTRAVTGYGGGGFGFDKSLGTNKYYEARPGSRYYLYGSLALLDAEGEWFQDAAGTIYL
jgi:hypothetical protein